MQFSSAIILFFSALAAAGPLDTRDHSKANEYTSTDCSGSVNFGHVSKVGYLGDVTMDDTSNSVYIAGNGFTAYSDKTKDGGDCSGTTIGNLPHGGCNTLELNGYRVKCIKGF